MKRSLIAFAIAAVLLSGVVAASYLADWWAHRPTLELGQEVELQSEASDGQLLVSDVDWDAPEEYGSLVPVHRIQLEADGLYSLKELVFSMEMEGLDAEALRDTTNWVLYPVKGQRINYTRPLGVGKSVGNGQVVFSVGEQFQPYFGEKGRQDWVLTTSVLKKNEPAYINLSLQQAKWVSGHYYGAWLDL